MPRKLYLRAINQSKYFNEAENFTGQEGSNDR